MRGCPGRHSACVFVNSYAASTDVRTVGTWVVSLLPSELCQCGSHNPSDAVCVTFGAEASGRRAAAARRFCAVVERASLTGWGISSRVFFLFCSHFTGARTVNDVDVEVEVEMSEVAGF